LGFAGALSGLTNRQRVELPGLFADLTAHADRVVLHHRQCVGADTEAHAVGVALGFETHGHPGRMPMAMLSRVTPDVLDRALPVRDRDLALVGSVDLLVVCVRDRVPLATAVVLDAAQRTGRVVHVVREDGKVEVRGGGPTGGEEKR
jgi:hypothetical protein